MQRFTLTEDHIKLARSVYMDWNPCEYGAPSVDPKNPYGDSDVEANIAKILGWDMPKIDAEKRPTDEQRERAAALHKQMETALAIILRAGTFEPGEYATSTSYSFDWHRA